MGLVPIDIPTWARKVLAERLDTLVEHGLLTPGGPTNTIRSTTTTS